jgi:hypothetical protein
MEDIKSVFASALQETMQMARQHAIQEADIKHQLEYVTTILPVLYEMDRTCAIAATEMIRSRTHEDQTNQFNAAWEGLKRLIYEIETREISTAKETNRFEG